MKRFIELLNEYGLKMDILPEKDFLKVVDSVLNTDESILSGIINDFDKNKKSHHSLIKTKDCQNLKLKGEVIYYEK